MFKITIEGDSTAALAEHILALAAMYRNEASYQADDAAREELQAKRSKGKKAAIAPEPEPEEAEAEDITAADAELKAAIAADERTVQPMPKTATALVDAGTGKPADPAGDQPIKMTIDDVKKAAAKLAASNVGKLGEILKKYDAAKLSDVKPADLGDFATDVMAELV